MNRLGNLPEDMFGGCGNICLRTAILQDDAKGVTRQMCHGVFFANRCLHAIRHILQDAVTDTVAESTVDRLESIHVNDDQRQRLPIAAGPQHRLPQSIYQQRTIRQSGKQIVFGQVREPGLLRYPVGDLAVDHQNGGRAVDGVAAQRPVA